MSELIPEWDALEIPENGYAEPLDAQPEHIPADDTDPAGSSEDVPE